MATHSSILAWRIPCTERSLAGCSPLGHKELDMTERLSVHDDQIPESSTIYNSLFLALCTVLTFEHSTLVMCCHSCGQLVRFWLSDLPTG